MSLITSILTGGTNNHETTSEEANATYTDFVSEGIVDSITNTSGFAPSTGGYAVNAQGTPDMTVAVTAGVAYVDGTPSGQNAQTFRVKNTATTNVNISANSSGSTKYDWIYVKLDATKLNDPAVGGDDAATLVTSRSTSSSSDDGTPPAYGYPIAIITVVNGASSITNSVIRDVRGQVSLNTGADSALGGWTALNATLTTSTGYFSAGREYNITSNTNLTSVLSPGMKLRITRGTVPPSQCLDLESGSSQYASKSSPSGVLFTDDFTCEAWIRLESYTAGTIVSRYDGSNGWKFHIDGNGRLAIYGDGASTREFTSFRAIRTGVWHHVAAALDMSSGSATIWINGESVACESTGSSGTSLTQAGNLQVGAANGSSFFDGKIADVRVWSVLRTDTQIRDNMNQQITGGESNLVAYFKLNGNLNDSTANANNLTGSGGAVATDSDNPMNVNEYAEILTVSSTNILVRCPSGYSIPNDVLSTPYYSGQDQPFGYPYGNKFIKQLVYGKDFSTTTTGSDVAVSGATTTFNLPAGGAWVRSTVFCYKFFKSGSAGDVALLKLYIDGVQVNESSANIAGSNYAIPNYTCISEKYLTAGSHTVAVYVNQTTAGTMQFSSAPGSTKESYLTVEYC